MTLLLAVNAKMILFPFHGPRLSTDLVFVAFLALAVRRNDPRPLFAAVAWMIGFEWFFEATRRPDEWHWIIIIAADALAIALLARKGVAPSIPLLALTLAVWAAWMATGFHVNEHTMVHFQPGAEAFNEGAKTLWAAAYFVPLWRARPAAGAPSPSRRTESRSLSKEPARATTSASSPSPGG